jgi:hypothetical protein
MEPLVAKIDEICAQVGLEHFPVTNRNVILDEEGEKEFRKLKEDVRKEIEKK